MKVLSLQVGKIEAKVDSHNREWMTATYKNSVPGALPLRRLGFEGDQHADMENHGGPDKAVLVYSHSHYPKWDASGLFAQPLPPGAFGENVLVEGMSERDVCLGDVYSLGSAVVRVSQPRQPCWKQSTRWNVKDLVVRMIEQCASGWYLRVQQEGTVQAGDSFALLERPHPDWTIERAHRVMHFEKQNPQANLELAGVAALADSWKRALLART